MSMDAVSREWIKGRRAAIIGAGPGGLSAALSLLRAGYAVRVFERHPEAKPIGGAVLLNIPVLMILRSYGIRLDGFSAPGHMWFGSSRGHEWASLPAPAEIERKSGIKGFTHGVLRSSAYRQMKNLIPEGVIRTGYKLSRFDDHGTHVDLHFDNGEVHETDILIGADGIQSVVSKQLFGDPELFHLGFKLWLAHCGDDPTIARNVGRLAFKPNHQVSYFPMMNDGVPGFEWWICEPFKPGTPAPADKRRYLEGIAADVDSPVRRLIDKTDMKHIYEWEIYNRKSLAKWSRGRVVCLGDAVHPVSPYAGYGMGMAIEDGYFLGKFLSGGNLEDASVVEQAFLAYERTRIDYVNGHVEHAREFGKMIHNIPRAAGVLRNFVFNRSSFIRKRLEKGYLEDALKETEDLSELHVSA